VLDRLACSEEDPLIGSSWVKSPLTCTSSKRGQAKAWGRAGGQYRSPCSHNLCGLAAAGTDVGLCLGRDSPQPSHSHKLHHSWYFLVQGFEQMWLAHAHRVLRVQHFGQRPAGLVPL